MNSSEQLILAIVFSNIGVQEEVNIVFVYVGSITKSRAPHEIDLIVMFNGQNVYSTSKSNDYIIRVWKSGTTYKIVINIAVKLCCQVD